MRTALAALVVWATLSCRAAEPWRERVTATTGPFPAVRPFQGEFRFGWSDIDAASAKAKLSYEDGRLLVDVSGGTTGLARVLWQLDAWHKAVISPEDFQPVYFQQGEKYKKKSVYVQAVSRPEGYWAWRQVLPDPKGTAKWRRIKVAGVRDILSALLFIRSQPLRDGDHVGVIAYPGDAPYFTEVTVAGRTQLRIGGVTRKAIKLNFQIQKIETKQHNKLVPHKKFRNGTVWISDDDNRIPLRAEVNIFIGYVFGELKSLSFEEGKP